MKTTKIASGYYSFEYKNQKIKIVRMEMPEENYKVYWYSEINGAEANDYSLTKKHCIESAIYMIDNAEIYGLRLVK